MQFIFSIHMEIALNIEAIKFRETHNWSTCQPWVLISMLFVTYDSCQNSNEGNKSQIAIT
jgi:hypothetical protein